MSLTPADRSDRRGQSSARSPPEASESESTSLVGRLFMGIATRASRVVSRLHDALGRSPEESVETTPISNRDLFEAENGEQFYTTVSLEEPDRPRVGDGIADSLPARDRPFTLPPQETDGDNAARLIGTVSGGELTVQHPGRPETRLSSDVWERVKR